MLDMFGESLKIGDVCLTCIENEMVPCMIYDETHAVVLKKNQLFNIKFLQLFKLDKDKTTQYKERLISQRHALEEKRNQELLKKKATKHSQQIGELYFHRDGYYVYMGKGKIKVFSSNLQEKYGHIYILLPYYKGFQDANFPNPCMRHDAFKVTKEPSLMKEIDLSDTVKRNFKHYKKECNIFTYTFLKKSIRMMKFELE